ncbi:MAG: hypothetical protein HYX34_13460 [Actinobacteria bacterium]|nr:hypothetical protein [Actinomycetota bacterium]
MSDLEPSRREAAQRLGIDFATAPTLPEVLEAAGVAPDEIEQAESEGTLAYLAIERLVLGEPPIYDLTEIAVAARMPAGEIAHLWRALGFPEPRPGERIFTASDVETLHTVAALLDLGVIDPDLAVQMSRVIGWSLARVASAQIDALRPLGDQPDGANGGDGPVTRGAGDASGTRPDGAADPELTVFAGLLLPTMPRILDYVWRRHMQAAARRALVRQSTGQAREEKAVGFADLVGFTALSQQLDERDLAALVDRFEALAYDTVTGLGGRVVKMIGDEVMFVVDDVRSAAEIALSLAEAYAADESLNDVRVGLAFGPLLEREADCFGPVVNRASRIVGIAFPGSVVVDEAVHDALTGDDCFAFRSIRARRLKDIGRVQLWSLRRGEPDPDHRHGPPVERDADATRRRVTERREAAIEALAERRHEGRDGRREQHRAARRSRRTDGPAAPDAPDAPAVPGLGDASRAPDRGDPPDARDPSDPTDPGDPSDADR